MNEWLDKWMLWIIMPCVYLGMVIADIIGLI